MTHACSRPRARLGTEDPDGAQLRTAAVHLLLPVQVRGRPRSGLSGLSRAPRSNTKQP